MNAADPNGRPALLPQCACGAPLDWGVPSATCTDCGSVFPNRGVLVWSGMGPVVAGDRHSALARELCRRGQGVKEDLTRIFSTDSLSGRRGEVLEVGAADWTFLLPAHESGAALQVGSGWGGGVLEMSARYSEVWSADPSGDLLSWQGIRRDAAGAKNLRLIQVPPGLLPFPEGSFDLVSFSESALQAARSGLPALMKTTRRVLRPGGWLHVGVRRSLRGTSSWIRLLRDHGFSDVRAHWAVPSSSRFVAAGRLDDPRSIVEFLRGRRWLKRNPAARLVLRAIARPMILKRVVPSLILLARREGAP